MAQLFFEKERNWFLRQGASFQVHSVLEQRAKEDVLQKEVRVKILKDNIKLLAAKVPSGGQELTSELNVVLENYQLLCNRIRGKCHTLEVWCFFTDTFLRFTFCNVLAASISWEETSIFLFKY